MATLTARASGVLEFHEATAPPVQSFYRTAQPQPRPGTSENRLRQTTS